VLERSTLKVLNDITQLRAGTLNLQGFGNFVLERSTLKV
jgi:hypothetical protein